MALRVLRGEVLPVFLIAAITVPAIFAQQPAFRVSTDAVYVAATVVAKDGTLVTDLGKNDFEVRDNGVERPIAVFRNDPIPFSIVIMLDVSGSMIENLSLMRAGVEELVRQFQPGDRANIGTFAGLPVVAPHFSSNPKALLSLVSASMSGVGAPCFAPGRGAAGRIVYNAGTAVWDAIACGIKTAYAEAETPRRAVVIVTDVMDNMSDTSPREVRDRAEELGIMVYGIGMRGMEGYEMPALRDLAERTGGGSFLLTNSADLPKTFARIADELRHQYVFGFSPTTAADPRHKIEVRTRRPDASVHFRQVYVEPSRVRATPGTGAFAPVESPAVSGHRPSAMAAPAGPRAAIAYALDRFEQGEWDEASALDTDRLLKLVSDGLKRDALPWVAEQGKDAAPRRRLAVATHALVALRDVDDPGRWQDTQPASSLLEAACAFLRQGAPLPAERIWHAAALALLTRSAPHWAVERHLQHAETRFPGEPRWTLLRAIVAEAAAPRSEQRDGTVAIPASANEKVAAAYEAASANASTAAEAQVRWGRYELMQGHTDGALAHFDRAGTPGDPIVQFWVHLFRGQALERAGRMTDAVASYRRAVATAPLAQSARLALASALVVDRQTSAAAAEVRQALAADQPSGDPWLFYDLTDVRFWPSFVSALLEAIRP